MMALMMMRLDVGVVMLFYMMFTCGSFTVMKNNDKFVSAYTRIATTVSLSEETQQQNRRFLDRVLDARDTHSMITFLPEETEGKPVPLVVALHGFCLQPEIQEAVMLRLVPYVTNTKKAMFAMPNAPSMASGVGLPACRAWDATEATRPFWMLWNRKPEGDVPYVMAAIDKAVATAAQNNVIVDWSKIYVYGLANGAFMAHRLLCEKPGMFAAAASYTGSTDFALEDTCTKNLATSPTSLLQIHGTLDTVVPYGGTPWWPGSEESARLVAEWNQCNLESPLTTESRLNTNPFFSYAVTSTRYEGCASNNVVEEWRVHGMDHLPGIAGGGLVEVSRKAVDWLLDESAVSAST